MYQKIDKKEIRDYLKQRKTFISICRLAALFNVGAMSIVKIVNEIMHDGNKIEIKSGKTQFSYLIRLRKERSNAERK